MLKICFHGILFLVSSSHKTFFQEIAGFMGRAIVESVPEGVLPAPTPAESQSSTPQTYALCGGNAIGASTDVLQQIFTSGSGEGKLFLAVQANVWASFSPPQKNAAAHLLSPDVEETAGPRCAQGHATPRMPNTACHTN